MFSTTAHLWAIGYEDVCQARQARDVVNELGSPPTPLLLLDTLIVVRNSDGAYTLDPEPQHICANTAAGGILGALVGWILSVPALVAAVGALVAYAASLVGCGALIDKKFVEDVKTMMKPGTSALFVLDDVGDIEVILHRIRGVGGTVLKTNVDAEQLRLVQSALSAASSN